MAENLNITNLELDDNQFTVIPDGDYHFTVDSHEVGYATSDKLPANTQQVTCYLDIPYLDESGQVQHAKVKNNLNIYKKALFAVRQFVECIGMVPEKGRIKVNLEEIDGKTGVCAITTATTKRGNEINNVQMFYPPSKVPASTANDEAWKKQDDFMVLPDDIDIDGII